MFNSNLCMIANWCYNVLMFGVSSWISKNISVVFRARFFTKPHPDCMPNFRIIIDSTQMTEDQGWLEGFFCTGISIPGKKWCQKGQSNPKQSCFVAKKPENELELKFLSFIFRLKTFWLDVWNQWEKIVGEIWVWNMITIQTLILIYIFVK